MTFFKIWKQNNTVHLATSWNKYGSEISLKFDQKYIGNYYSQGIIFSILISEEKEKQE